MNKRIIVIGGGMAGTSAAYHLSKRGYHVTILEKNDRLGGRVHSQLVDEVALEHGAGFVSNLYPNLLDFLEKSGLEKYLRTYQPDMGIVYEGEVRAVSLRGFLAASPLPWREVVEALKLLMRTVARWKTMDSRRISTLARCDEVSIAEKYCSRSGEEFLKNIIQPVLTATFYWLPEDVERTSEALLLFCGKAALMGGARKLCCGLQRIPETLAEKSTVLLGCAVTGVKRNPQGTYAVSFETEGVQKILEVDGIVCATTASAVTKLFPNLTEDRRKFFESVRYSSATYAGHIYRNKDVRRGIGNVAFPLTAHTPVVGVSVMRQPDVNMAISDILSIKISAAGKLYEEGSDVLQKLMEGIRPIAKALFVGNPEPLHSYVWHWEEALPILPVGYFKRLKHFLEQEEASKEPLVFAGDYLGGPFMEGAFVSGMRAAEKLDSVFLKKN